MKKEYLSYDLETLLDNQEFTEWVSRLNDEDICNHFNKNREELENIFAAKSILSYAQVVEPHNINKEDVWEKINLKTKPEQKQPKVFSLYTKVAGLAAVIVAGWLVFTQIIDKTISVSTNYGEIKEQQLPDGSIVSLNANSTIDYQKDFKSDREVRLEGEAFFEVQKGSKFTVVTASGNVEVLGTSFNVNAKNQTLSVYCRTGKVLVYNKTINKESVLQPGQSVSFENGNWEEVNTIQDITWQMGNQHYEKISLKKASKILESFYGVHFKIEEGTDTLYYNGIITFDNINKSVEEITWPFRLKYKINKDTVYIKSN